MHRNVNGSDLEPANRCTQQLSKHVVNKMTELVSCDLPNLSVTKVIFFLIRHVRSQRPTYVSVLLMEASRLERVPQLQQHLSLTFFFDRLLRGPVVCLLVQFFTASTDAVAFTIPLLLGMGGNLTPSYVVEMICYRMTRALRYLGLELSVNRELGGGAMKIGRTNKFGRAET